MSNFLYDSYIVLNRIYSQKTYLKQALNAAPLDPAHKALTVKCVYGVVENDLYLEHLISLAAQKPPKLAVKIILKQALYLIKFTDKPVYTVTNEAVDLAKKLGKGGVSGFINALLRKIYSMPENLPADKIKYLSVKYSYPEFALKKLILAYGDGEAEKIAAYRTDLVTVRFKSAYFAKCFENLTPTPFENVFFAKNFTRGEGFDKGEYTFQSIGSVAVCHAVETCQNLLDACAAPGGKSVLLAERCEKVTAFELYAHRAELIESYKKRMGAENIDIICRDSSKYDKNYEQQFDAVLTDVLCSGYGVAHENPDIKLNRDVNSLAAIKNEQLNIITACSNYVKKSGYLYYSTCSVFPEENDGIIGKFLQSGAPFIAEEVLSPLSFIKTKFGIQFLPHLSLGAGFYISRLKRV